MTQRVSIIYILFISIGMIGNACGDDSGDDDSSNAGNENNDNNDDDDLLPQGSFDEGTCTVEVTGDINFSYTGPGGSPSIGSDYWTSDEDLFTAYNMFEDEEDEAGFNEFLATGRAIMSFLLMNCTQVEGGDNALSVWVAGTTVRDDFPMAPGTYPIINVTDYPSATFGTNIFFDDGMWSNEDGTIVIDAWDEQRIAGTFEFPIVEGFGGDRTANVTGSFDFDCPSDYCKF